MYQKLIAFLLIFSSIDSPTIGKRTFDVSWTNITCTSKPDIALVTCETGMYNGRTVVNIMSHLFKDVKSAQGHVIIDIMRKQSSVLRLFDLYVDGCKFLNGLSDESVVSIIYKIFKKFSTFPNKCPLMAGKNYTLDHFYLDPEMLPVYTPETAFYFSIDLRDNGTPLLNLSLNGLVEPKFSFKTPLSAPQLLLKN